MKKKTLKNLLPKRNDRCAVASLDCIKSASLIFDKVYLPNENENISNELLPPQELCFGFTLGDISASVECAKLADKILWGNDGPPELPENVDEIYKMIEDGTFDQKYNPTISSSLYYMQYRGIANGYSKFGLDVTPVYSKEQQFLDEFLPGTDNAYQAIINNVLVIDEIKTEWNHILEFKKDKNAYKKYRNLHIWLRDSLKAKSVNHATDLINIKIDNYEWALKKHGFKTVLGSISSLLDWKMLTSLVGGAAISSILGNNITVALTSGIILLGKASIFIAERKLDLEDIKNTKGSEISLIHEINEKFK